MTRVANHILVDASIAKSAADPARHPTSAACLSFARALADGSCLTGAAMTPSLSVEWKRHASRFMVAWLAQMESRRRVRREADRQVRDLRIAVAAVTDPGVKAALEKDLHLSEAAIFYALPVASRDDKQARFLAALTPSYSPAGSVQWVNPELHGGELVAWLHSGCVDRSTFTCDSRPTPS